MKTPALLLPERKANIYHPCQWPYPPQFPEPRRSHPESDRHSGQQLFLSLSYPQWDEKITHLREVNGRVHAPCLSIRRVQSLPKTEESTFFVRIVRLFSYVNTLFTTH